MLRKHGRIGLDHFGPSKKPFALPLERRLVHFESLWKSRWNLFGTPFASLWDPLGSLWNPFGNPFGIPLEIWLEIYLGAIEILLETPLGAFGIPL